MQIISPKTITRNQIKDFLLLRDSVNHLTDCKISCNCSPLQFIDTLGLCLLKHWFIELNDRGVQIFLSSLRYSLESFMRRMNLFNDIECVTFTDRTSHHNRNDLRGSLIELQSLYQKDQINPAATHISEIIVGRLSGISKEPDPEGMRPSEADRVGESLEYVFSEILLNALDHGRRRNYAHSHVNIAAHAGRENLEIAIVDNGCGLLETLQGHPAMEGQDTDEKAISIALQPRVSCNRDAELGLDTKNQGIGLTVSTQVAFQTGGFCSLFSGSSSQVIYGNGDIQTQDIPYWRGTGISFILPKMRLLNVDRGAIIASLPGYRTVPDLRFE